MLPSEKPIVINLPEDYKNARILLSADMHYGNACFDELAWHEFESDLAQENTYAIFAGDQMEYATRTSKSDVYTALRPAEQKRWWIEHLRPYKQKILCIVDGNHCFNRASKDADSFPLFDIAMLLGISERYRSEAAFLNLGIGQAHGGKRQKPRQIRYVFRVQHKAQNQVNFGTADSFDGIDIFVAGHTHKPMSKPLAKLVYDPYNNRVTQKNVRNVVCGHYLRYPGSYGERGGMRITSNCQYAVLLDGTRKRIKVEEYEY